MVEAPAGLLAHHRGPGGELGAVADEGDLGAPHQLVRRAGAHLDQLAAHPVERLDRDLQLLRGLGRGHVVVDEPAQLVLDLRLRRPVRVAQRPVDQLVRVGDLVLRQRGPAGGQVRRGVRAGQVAEDERADHVVVRHAGQVAGGVQPGHGGLRVLVHPDAGRRVAAAQPDLGDVHLHVVGAVVVPAALVEGAPGRPLGVVQDPLDRGDRLLRQVGELEVDRAARGVDLRLHLGHHLAGPVVAVDEPVALGVDLVAAERVGDVGARRAVVVLDQRVDLEALDAAEARPRRGRPSRSRRRRWWGSRRCRRGSRCAGRPSRPHAPVARTTAPGRDGDELAGAGVERDRADRAAVDGEHAHRHQPVLDGELLADLAVAHHPVEDLLDVLALRHRQHVAARAVHPADGVLAVLVLLELHAVLLQALHHGEAAGRGLPDGGLVDDAVVGAGDLGDVVLRRRLARDDRVVDAVHAHREGAGVADVRLLQQQYVGAGLGRGDRGHRAGGAAADDEHVAAELAPLGDRRDREVRCIVPRRLPRRRPAPATGWSSSCRAPRRGSPGRAAARGSRGCSTRCSDTTPYRPSTTIRSPSTSASSTSWVTNTTVHPDACQASTSSRCIDAAGLGVERPERLVHADARRARRPGRGPAAPAAACRRRAGRAAGRRSRDRPTRDEPLVGPPPPLGPARRPGPPAAARRCAGPSATAAARRPGTPGHGRRPGRHAAAVGDDLAGDRPDQPGDRPQQGGLAAAGVAEHDQDLAGRDVEVDVLDDRLSGVARGDEVGRRRTARSGGVGQWSSGAPLLGREPAGESSADQLDAAGR